MEELLLIAANISLYRRWWHQSCGILPYVKFISKVIVSVSSWLSHNGRQSSPMLLPVWFCIESEWSQMYGVCMYVCVYFDMVIYHIVASNKHKYWIMDIVPIIRNIVLYIHDLQKEKHSTSIPGTITPCVPLRCIDTTKPLRCIDTTTPLRCIDTTTPLRCTDATTPLRCIGTTTPLRCNDNVQLRWTGTPF